MKTEAKRQSNNIGITKSCLKQQNIKSESNGESIAGKTIPLDAISQATVAILETASLSENLVKRQ